MAGLAELQCTVCRMGDTPLSPAEMAAFSQQVPEWKLIKQKGVPKLQRIFHFSDYPAALSFTQAVGSAAQNAGHHPLILIEWGKVTVTWWTHKINGLHANDFIMVARCDHIYING